MGLYFRKSLKLGPIRLNFSGAGIGVSAGIPGARVTAGPRGTYVTVGAHGFRYRQRLDVPAPRRRAEPAVQLPGMAGQIATADASALVDASSQAVVESLNANLTRWRLAPAVALAVLGSQFLLASPVTLVLGGLLAAMIHRGDRQKRTTALFYEVDPAAEARLGGLAEGPRALNGAARAWRIVAKHATDDWKRNAGASALITRTPAAFKKLVPPFVTTNVEVWGLELADQALYFLPDQVLVWQGGRYGAVSYEDLSITYEPTRFIEDGPVPRDAEVVDHTWLYVRKDGGPDLRFNNNRQLPVARYGHLVLGSATGLNIHVHVSDWRAAEFAAAALATYQRADRQARAMGEPQRAAAVTGMEAWYRTIGLAPGASPMAIDAARERLQAQYAPARLAGLDSAFADLAEERRAEIEAAYAALQGAPSPPEVVPAPVAPPAPRPVAQPVVPPAPPPSPPPIVEVPRPVTPAAPPPPPPPPQRAETRDDEAACWVGAGQNGVQVGSHHIPGGLLYVGERLAPLNGYGGAEPALIDPRLPARVAVPAHLGEGMDYWPSYSSIPDACRAAYLAWLADGRRAPEAYIGYVFLYFYGLERRFVRPLLTGDEPVPESAAIEAELVRLLSIYGRNNSFRTYAGAFLELVRFVSSDGPLYLGAPSEPRFVSDFPLGLQLGLGQLAREGRPVPATWALAWALTRSTGALRTPATRCAQEFRALFAHRYAAEHGEGLIIKPGKKLLHAEYQPASPSFGARLTVSSKDMPDVRGLETQVNRLVAIADRACDDLDAYSRLLGRKPEAAGTAAALALLPPELAAERTTPALDALLGTIHEGLAVGPVVPLPAAAILAAWPCAGGAKMTKAEATVAVQALARWGYGLEPDPRFGGQPFATESPAVAFELEAGAPTAPAPEYLAATTFLAVGAATADADGAVAVVEAAVLRRFVDRAPGCDTAERARLGAHLELLLAAPPGLMGMKKRLAGLTDAQRAAIWGFVLELVLADGVVDKGEVKLLGKLAPLLGRDADRVFEEIHAASAARARPADGPVLVEAGGSIELGFTIPAATVPAPVVPGRLDMAVVRAKQAETAAVSALLGSVFVDDEPASVAVAVAPMGPCAPGLDAAHTALLVRLAGRDTITRAALEALAAELHLMPDGALDALNEAGLDACGRPLCEGEDPIALDREAIEELLP